MASTPANRTLLPWFLLAGAVLLGIDLWRTPEVDSSEAPIVVPAEAVEALREGWVKRMARPPDEAEEQGLIDKYVEEEVLVRQALELGFERGDLIVRRRLLQKMEFLLEDIAPVAPPSDEVLQAWLDNNVERYATPASVAFDHVYFSRDRHGEQTESRAREALAGLTPDMDVDPAAALGDPSMRGAHQSLRSVRKVQADFGPDFASSVEELDVGGWHGPVSSSFGLHLVRLLEKHPGGASELEAVRPTVLADWMSDARSRARAVAVAEWRDDYEIEVHRP